MPPDSVQELIEIIGITDAGKLIRQHGGTTLFFSSNLREKIDISDSAWEALEKVYQGNSLYIPRNYSALMAKRNMQIKADRVTGHKIPELCRKYNLTDRRIFAICSAAMVDSSQVDLFST